LLILKKVTNPPLQNPLAQASSNAMNFADLNWEARFRFHQKWLNYTRHMYKSFIALQNEV